MRRGGAFLLTSLVFLFFAEGQRAFFASLFALTSRALDPAFEPGAAFLALLPLLALLVPFLPLARVLDRPGAITVAAAGVAIFRLPMAHPALATRVVGSALVLAFFGLFLTWAVGWLDRRALAAGAVAGLVADQLLRLAGTGYDLALQPAWVPVQAALSLLLLTLAVAWGRTGDGRETGPGVNGGTGLERRAGGLRLRGALALGPLLFLDLHLLGLPPVVARWAELPYETTALAAAIAGATALGLALVGHGPTRGRATVVALVAAVALALGAGWWTDGAGTGLLMAAGHAAALLLIARTLDPASGRRGRAVTAAVLGGFTAFTGLYTLAFFVTPPLPLLDPAAPWVIGAAMALLAGSAVLLPGAATTPPALRPRGGVAIALGVTAMAALLLWVVVPPAPPAPARARAQPASREAVPERPGRGNERGGGDRHGGVLVVGTGDAHYGFDGAWRFDPKALAGAVADAAVDAVVLEAVPAGIPLAYGMDLPLWLERRLGAAVAFAPSTNGLLGEALLVRQARGVAIHAVPPAAAPGTAGAWARAIPPGPAVVLAAPGQGAAALAEPLRRAGFRGVAEAGPEPVQRGVRGGPWLWVRDLGAVTAGRPGDGSRFDLLTASVELRPVPATAPARP